MSVRVVVTLEQRLTKTYEFQVSDTDDETLAATIIKDQLRRSMPEWHISLISTRKE